VTMRRDAAIADKIRRIFSARGRVMPENNLRQADVPIGARVMAEMPGTAPGLVCPVGNKVIYAVPGVPSEMRAMMSGTVIPDLRRRSGQSAVIRSRVLRTWGMSESGLAEVLAPRVDDLDRLGNPTIAYQASGIEGIKVRIVAKCDDEATAARVLDSEEALLRGLLGEVVFGIDGESMEVVVLKLLRNKAMTLAAAESVTGGLLASRMSAVDPAMRTFRGALIGTQEADGRPALERASSAALRARRQWGADVGLAAVAEAPGVDERAGTRPVALAVAMGSAQHSETTILPGDGPRLREFAVINLLNLLRRKLAEDPA